MTGNRKISLLIDSGADISVIKICNINPQQQIYYSHSVNIKGVTQNLVKTLGTTRTSIFFGNNALPHEFHVVENNFPIPADGILGRDFLTRRKCILNYDKWTMHFKSNYCSIEVPMLGGPIPNFVTIPPRCEVIRTINDSKLCDEGNVILNEEIAPGIFVASSIVSRTYPYIRLINITNENVQIDTNCIRHEKLTNYDIFQVNETNNEQNRQQKLLTELKLKVPDFIEKDLKNLCLEYNDIFGLKDDPITTNNFYKQKLRLNDENPVYIKNYRTPNSQKVEIQQQVEKMLKNKIIEPSIAEYNSPILLVPKKSQDGNKKWRLVVDYRQLNKKLVGDKFPLPRLDDILDQLGRAKWFSTVDLTSGFHQIPLDLNSRDFTTFSTENGSYRFTRLPFGLKVSPNSFQRMMTMAFAGITPERAFLYMDDLVVIGCSTQHHLYNLKKVFETCRKYNLKLNPEKCTSSTSF